MKSGKKALILLLAFALLLGGAYVLYGKLSRENAAGQFAPESSSQPSGGSSSGALPDGGSSGSSESSASDPAPDFTVYDSDGNAVHLSDFYGRPVVLNFWASWCGPCKSEMPDIDEAFTKYGGDVVFLIVNMTDGFRETQDSAQGYIDGQGYSFPIYFDTEQDAATAYGIRSIPQTYFIGADGSIAGGYMGAMSAEVLESGIAAIAGAA